MSSPCQTLYLVAGNIENHQRHMFETPQTKERTNDTNTTFSDYPWQKVSSDLFQLDGAQ